MNTALLEIEAPALPMSTMTVGKSWLSVNQPIAGGVMTKIMFDTIEFDTTGGFIAPDRFTAQTAGFYMFLGSVLGLNVGGNSTWEFHMRINGATRSSINTRLGPANISLQALGLWNFNVGDFLEIFSLYVNPWTASASQTETIMSVIGPM